MSEITRSEFVEILEEKFPKTFTITDNKIILSGTMIITKIQIMMVYLDMFMRRLMRD